MSYINPIVESSYYENDLGKTIYDFIINYNKNIDILITYENVTHFHKYFTNNAIQLYDLKEF